MFNQVATNLHAFATGCRLSDIVSDIAAVQIYGPQDAAVANITTDSRRVSRGSVFAAVEGEHVDGHRFVQRAIEAGAVCVVVQLRQYEEGLKDLLTPAYCQHNGSTVAIVHDTREAVAVLADRYYDSPSRDLKLIGITGTNGKTTISWLLQGALRAAKLSPGMIGTVEYRIGDTVLPATYTTPPAEDLHRMFRDMRKAGCKSAVMEVSSHALALKRVHGISFDVSVFTNLTQDHLDFHGDMDAYRDAKGLLFSAHTRGVGLLNADDPVSSHLRAPLGRRGKLYGQHGKPAFRMRDIEVTAKGTSLTIEHAGASWKLRSSLVGAFNAYNLTAAFAAAVLLGIDPEIARRGIQSVKRVPGRFERILSADGVAAIVDYSHTPDSLAKALQTARALVGAGRVITVFGCGGDRDKGKRPYMGAVASSMSDLAIITSDNPRTEDPAAIIAAVYAGVQPGREVMVRSGRKAAIHQALKLARPGDIVLVAGKGHENYQIIGTTKRHFDDSEVVRAYFEARRGGVQ
ncbi:MAG: UDP-N-acetylmuramoyl-L-alanyl-D-glutamate--2,6-diaminopimelate ligase [Bacteroidia bacterium]|nr:UDP-N-acetylmuramoyl-L-alanyl-D-glutamate--2,6-diaminopimelate ligase [Bacteroidia bacterium]